MGAGVGAAAAGLRPVVDAMWADFTGLAFDQIYNQAGKMSYMFGGQARLPLTIRVAMGCGLSAAAQHSGHALLDLHAPARDQGRRAVDAVRRQGPAARVDLRRQPGAVLRAPEAVRGQGRRCPEEPYRIPLGWPRCAARAPTSRSSRSRRWSSRALAGGRVARCRGVERRGDRPADALAARRGHDRRVGREDRAARRRRREPAALQRRLGDRRRRVRAGVRLSERARCAGSRRRTRPCPSARRWRTSTRRRWSRSSRRWAPRLRDRQQTSSS